MTTTATMSKQQARAAHDALIRAERQAGAMERALAEAIDELDEPYKGGAVMARTGTLDAQRRIHRVLEHLRVKIK